MATAIDVSAYIFQKLGPMSAMKLQKLCYYSQAWHMVWEDSPLFMEPIEAWANGPVIRKLYGYHRGLFIISEWPHGDATQLTEDERTSVDAVLESYGSWTAHQLSQKSHSEPPWIDARAGVADGDFCEAEITQESIAEYFNQVALSGQ